MTLADLRGLIRVRNAFLNRTQLQFTLDLANHGIWPGEIDPSLEADVNGAREWRTQFGRLVERKGVLSLEPVDLDVRSGYSSRVAGGQVQ